MTRHHLQLLLLFCLLSTISFSVNGQTTFSRTIDVGLGGIIGNAMKVSSNGDCLFTARKSNDLCIFKTDSAGNLIYEKSILNFPFPNTLSISHSADGGFILHNAGETLSQQPASSLLIDSSGNTVWIKTHSINVPAIFTLAEELADGSTILVGQMMESNGVDYDNILMHLDSAGNHDWTKSIVAPGTQYINSLAATSDGDFVIIDRGFPIQRNLMRLTASGNIIYAKKYGSGINDGLRIEKFHETASGRNFLTASFANLPSQQQFRVSLIIEIDTIGEIYTQKAFLNQLNQPLFIKNSFLFEDAGGVFKVFASAPESNFNLIVPSNVLFHMSMNSQFSPYNVRFQPILGSSLSITHMQKCSQFDFLQVVKIDDHWTSSPLVEYKTSFRKLSFASTNPCIYELPTTILDTTVNTLQPVNLILNLNSYIGSTSLSTLPISTNSFISNSACTPTSIEVLDYNNSITLYPNPASTKLFIKSEDINLFEAEYSVFNMLGEEVFNGRIISNNISIENLTPQNYILQLKMKEQNHYIRFVKN